MMQQPVEDFEFPQNVFHNDYLPTNRNYTLPNYAPPPTEHTYCVQPEAELENNPVNIYEGHEDARICKRRTEENANTTGKRMKAAEDELLNSYKSCISADYSMNPVENQGPEDVEVAFALPNDSNGFEQRELVLYPNASKVEMDSSTEDKLKIIRRRKKLLSIFNQFSEITETHFTFRQHFEHAFSCPKLNGDQCCQFENCTNPSEITDFVVKTLQSEYKSNCYTKEQENINMVHLVLLWHAIMCSNLDICSMPLCSQMEEVIEKLIPEAKFDGCKYEVLYSNDCYNGKMYWKEGTDFHIDFDMGIAKGAFGTVTYSKFNHHGKTTSAAIKRVDLNATKLADKGITYLTKCFKESTKALKKLRRMPNILAPDLILMSQNEIMMVMEKAECSLFDLIRHRNGMEADEVIYYMFQLVKGVNQIHECGYTHGDIKVPNCVLTKGYRELKITDLDTLKKEETNVASGTPGYVSPDVIKNRTVRKPDDVYSTVSCIPVLFAGRESILGDNRENLTKYIATKNPSLAMMYFTGTQKFESRITATSLVKWFRDSPDLVQPRKSFTPTPPEQPKHLSGKAIAEMVFKRFFTAKLDAMSEN